MRKNHSKKSTEKNNVQKKDGFIRLISGKWRGKKLPVKDLQGLRPTTDRTKETLFNWLMHDIRDANCLDCFSGSGSLGFEALSRFASNVEFIERDINVVKQLQLNAQQLQSSDATIIHADTIKYLSKQSDKAFNIVFVDPPFNCDLVQPCCALLEENEYLADNALIYIERESTIDSLTLPNHWQLIKEKQTGQVIYQLYRR